MLKIGRVAQLVEQRTHKPLVASSTLAPAIIICLGKLDNILVILI